MVNRYKVRHNVVMVFRLLLAVAKLSIVLVPSAASGQETVREPAATLTDKPAQCQRIVSLAPSITESLFLLGLGDRIVGVTRFCRYPPEAARIPSVGGLYDLSSEGILRLKPTHVFALREHSETIGPLKRFEVLITTLDNSRVAGIKAGIETICRICGCSERSSQVLAVLSHREERLKAKFRTDPPVRTLVVVGRSNGGAASPLLYISGSDGYYTDVLELAGAVNVHQGKTMAIPSVSEEGIRILAPEAVLEIVPVDDSRAPSVARQFWERLHSIPAVQRGMVLIENDDFSSIPGPRYMDLAEKVAQEIHPGTESPNE